MLRAARSCEEIIMATRNDGRCETDGRRLRAARQLSAIHDTMIRSSATNVGIGNKANASAVLVDDRHLSNAAHVHHGNHIIDRFVG